MTAWLQSGDQLGRFDIVSRLAGGQANIYQAVDRERNWEVCLKIFRDRAPQDESSRRLIAHYENIRSKIGRNFQNYAYIPFGIEVIEDELVAVLPWSHGITLRQIMVDGAPWADRFRIALALANVVRWLHKVDVDEGKSSRLCHLDLKPENVMVEFATEEGQVKPFIRLIDFDNARVDGAGATETLLGSPCYRSPEQAVARQFSELRHPEKSDVFSLGVILFELLCGKRPYKDESFDAAAAAYQVDLEGVQELNVLDSLFKQILLALHPNPDSRPTMGWLHSSFHKSYETSGLAAGGTGSAPWSSPRACFIKITQTPGFERVYQFEDGPLNVDYRRLAGAKFKPSDRDLNLILYPSPVGWYVKPSSDEVRVCMGESCLNEKRNDRFIEVLVGPSYQVHFGPDARFNLRLQRI